MNETTPRPSNAPAEATHRMDYARDSTTGEPIGTVWPVRIVTPASGHNARALVAYWEAGRETADPYEMSVPDFARLTPYALPVTRTAPTPPEATHYMHRTDATIVDDNAYPCAIIRAEEESILVRLWYPDGERVLYNEYRLYPEKWILTLITPADATSAPQEPASDTRDAITRWSDAMTPSERVAALATFWQTCDEEADEQGACEQYERSYAWRNGHPGRDDKQTREWEAEVIVRTTVTRTRTYNVTVEATDEGEAEDEARNLDLGWHSPDDEREDEEDEEIEASVSAYDPELSEPTPLDEVVRAAIEHVNARDEYHVIPTAGLRALIEQHACPVTYADKITVSCRASIEDANLPLTATPIEGQRNAYAARVIQWRGTVTTEYTRESLARRHNTDPDGPYSDVIWNQHIGNVAASAIRALVDYAPVTILPGLSHEVASKFQVNA